METIRKYLSKKYLEQFQRSGRLRIGTLDLYRSHENQQIRDETEGTIEWSNNGESVESPPELLRLFDGSYNGGIRNVDGSKPRIYIGEAAQFNVGIHLPNAYVFCTSSAEIDPMKARFGCDSYFTITDPHEFGGLLLDGINDAIKPNGVNAYSFDWVAYQESKNIKLSPENDKINVQLIYRHEDGIERDFWHYFTKEALRFGEELEFRFVFSCDNPPIDDYLFVNLDVEGVARTVVFDPTLETYRF